MSTKQSTSLAHLPVELLYEIYPLAQSSCLPLTCKYIYTVFKSAPSSLHAQYLIQCYNTSLQHPASSRAVGFVTKALRYPICTREVLEAIFQSPHCPPIPSARDKLQYPTVLPRHLFRNLAPRDGLGQRPWTEFDEPLPFLKFLYAHPSIPFIATNSYDGYALTRAVYAGFMPLVRFLLANGASPECKGHLAVTVAIRRKSLALVRLLVERDLPEEAPAMTSKKRRRSEVDGDSDGRSGGGSSKQSKQSKAAPGKRRKLGDRISVTPDMLKAAVKCDAGDIADYLMREKGCVPDMQTVLMMGR
ncbi:hypothetical protein C2E23DRAFT_881989 [Lenzites betulinus]|nr:hypothetical protein C2E23DRAFT_881989 [Lenzites betulinus]